MSDTSKLNGSLFFYRLAKTIGTVISLVMCGLWLLVGSRSPSVYDAGAITQGMDYQQVVSMLGRPEFDPGLPGSDGQEAHCIWYLFNGHVVVFFDSDGTVKLCDYHYRSPYDV